MESVNIQKKRVKLFYETVGQRTQRKKFKIPAIEEYHKRERSFLSKFVRKKDIVLELGCGEGRFLKLLESKAKSVVGLDYAKNALKVSARLVGAKTLLVEADAAKMPLFNEYFSKIICAFNTFGTMPEKKKILKGCYRVLRKGGTIILSVYSKEALHYQLELYRKAMWVVTNYDSNSVFTKEGLVSSRFSKEELKKLLKTSKFRNVKIFPLTKISLIAIAKK